MSNERIAFTFVSIFICLCGYVTNYVSICLCAYIIAHFILEFILTFTLVHLNIHLVSMISVRSAQSGEHQVNTLRLQMFF